MLECSRRPKNECLVPSPLWWSRLDGITDRLVRLLEEALGVQLRVEKAVEMIMARRTRLGRLITKMRNPRPSGVADDGAKDPCEK